MVQAVIACVEREANETMNWDVLHLNLLLAWVWILAGFASGALLGLRFTRDNWLGGYTSIRRRMYRLGHISFFGLGILNLMFYLTANRLSESPALLLSIASWAFMLGALLMPASCLILAHHETAKPHILFAVPVGSLLTGGATTLWMLLRP